MLLTLSSGRADALNHAHETAQNLVSIISSDLERNVEVYELSLEAMVDGAREPGQLGDVGGAVGGAGFVAVNGGG